MKQTTPSSKAGVVKSSQELGHLIRAFRKERQFTLEKVSGMTKLGIRFLSELERGKETVELGKVLTLLNCLGLVVLVQPRGYQNVEALSKQTNE